MCINLLVAYPYGCSVAFYAAWDLDFFVIRSLLLLLVNA